MTSVQSKALLAIALSPCFVYYADVDGNIYRPRRAPHAMTVRALERRGWVERVILTDERTSARGNYLHMLVATAEGRVALAGAGRLPQNGGPARP
jgi:hypothetical protein